MTEIFYFDSKFRLRIKVLRSTSTFHGTAVGIRAPFDRAGGDFDFRS